jgi:hypothetical protein
MHQDIGVGKGQDMILFQMIEPLETELLLHLHHLYRIYTDRLVMLAI